MTHFAARLLMATAVLSFLAFFGLLIADVFVRWTTNQNFTFFGGFGELALGIVLAVCIWTLSHSTKHEHQHPNAS